VTTSTAENVDNHLPCDDTDTPADGQREGDTSGPSGGRRLARLLARRWRPVVVTSLVLASAGTAATLYLDAYRGDRASTEAATEVAKAASEGAVALLSYAPASLDSDIASARSHLTGGFLTYYSQFADQFVAPAAKQKDIHAVASVVRAATIDAHATTAHVLIFLNQTTTSRENHEPAQSASSVNVGLTKVDGVWRISSFDPI
jgi:Mce-associated membrane protein